MEKNIFFKHLFFLVLFLPCIAVAQEKSSVYGYIIDRKTGKPLSGANIFLVHTQEGTSSNASGFYRLSNVEAGNYEINISFVGYKTLLKKIKLDTGQSLRLDIEIASKDFRLGSTVIQSKRKKEKKSKIGVRNIKTQFVKKIPSVFESDVFRALQLLPGVKAASDFSSGLYIRGGGPGQNLTLLDGAPVYNPTHFFGFYSTFNTDAISNVRLYKGAYPAKYGGRLGSVLSIETQKGNQERIAGAVSAGLLASRVQLGGPFKKGSWMVAVRRSTLEPYLSVAKDYASYIPDKFHFWDFNGKLNLELNDDDKFSLSAYAGFDNVKFPLANSVNTKLRYGNQVFSANWSHIFSPKVSSNFIITGSRYFNYPSFNVAGIANKRTNTILDFSAKGEVEYRPDDRQIISAGFQLGKRRIKYDQALIYSETYIPESLLYSKPLLALLLFYSRYTPESIKQFIPDYLKTYAKNYIQQYLQEKDSNLEKPVSYTTNTPYGSLYLQDKLKISKRWTIIPGLRLNGYGEGSYWKIDPRLSIKFEPAPKIRFRAAYGRYHQFLSLITNQAFSGFDTWLSAGKGVKPEYGDQYVLGVDLNPKHGYELRVETYYRTMNDLFDLNPFLPDLGGLDYDQLFRFGKGYAYGIDISSHKSIGRLTASLGYSYSVTRRKYPNYNKPLSGQGGARFFPPRYDRRHDIKAVLSYKLSSRWKTTAVFQYASGQAYTKPSKRTRAFNLPFQSYPVDQLVIDKVNDSRLSPYQRLDIGFSRSGTFLGIGKAKWNFQLVNTYSYRNIWFYNYNFAANPIQREAVQMLPILPNISYSVKF